MLPELHPYFIFRLMFAMLILVGAFIGLYNIWMSLYGRRTRHRRGRAMRMSVGLIIIGGLIVFGAVLLIAVILPWTTITDKPSDIYRPRTALEEEGRKLYIANGCTFCHTQFIRSIDWGHGAERVARAGDYVADQPHLLGTERTGPDLSQEGGERPDDWHLAHFTNPRFTRPESIMPAFEFLGPEKIRALIAYKQSLGFRMADLRVQRQRYWKAQAIAAYEAGPDKNVDWLHSWVPDGWRNPAEPLPHDGSGPCPGASASTRASASGATVRSGTAWGRPKRYLYPPPLNFTILKGQGDIGRHPLLPDHERHHRDGDDVLQEGPGVGKDLERGQLRGGQFIGEIGRGQTPERHPRVL